VDQQFAQVNHFFPFLREMMMITFIVFFYYLFLHDKTNSAGASFNIQY